MEGCSAIGRMNLCKEIIMKLYLVKFQFSKKECYALWYTDDVDGFLLDDNGKIRSFASEEETRLFANREGYYLDDEIALISSDTLLSFGREEIDCNFILTYWNIFSDLARTVNCKFLGDNSDGDVEGIYQKLFYGCNLSAIRKDGEIFVPEWNESERKRLAEILDNGFKILSDAIV